MTRDDKAPPPADDLPEIELSDDDILDAMSRIPGYIDVSTEDFREIYHLAHRHAIDRLFGRLRARNLMRSGVPSLSPDLMMDAAAKIIADSGYKGLPVCDANGRVVGMLTETDYLRRLEAGSFLELFLRLIQDSCEITHRCHETPVGDAMTAPAVAVDADAGFAEIMSAFERHPGRSAPVIDADGRFCGLLLRKDSFAAFNLETCL